MSDDRFYHSLFKADGESYIAKQAFAREKRSKDHGTNTDDEVLSDKEKAILVSENLIFRVNSIIHANGENVERSNFQL